MILSDLGLVCDKAGRYSEAFIAFEGCNKATAIRNNKRFNYKNYISYIHSYKNAINKKSVEEWEKYIPSDDEQVAPIFLLVFLVQVPP